MYPRIAFYRNKMGGLIKELNVGDAKELNSPLTNFFLSDEFEEMCDQNGFKTLQDIVDNHVSDLLNKPGFNLRILKELVTILERYHLENTLKD